MKTIAGIDLGTTFSALAAINSLGKPEVLPNLDEDRLTPSVVFFPQDAPGTIKVDSGPVTARQEQFSSRTPISRLGSPDDVAPAIVYLADKEKSPFVTGTCIKIDGGQPIPCLADNTYTPRVPPVIQ